MQSTLERLAKDDDLTLNIANYDDNKNLNVLLPYLFKTSSQGAETANTQFYDSVLDTLLSNLKNRKDPSLDLLGSVCLMTKVVEMEPNVDKRLVTHLYEEIRHRIEA
jgi:hypothetical protein